MTGSFHLRGRYRRWTFAHYNQHCFLVFGAIEVGLLTVVGHKRPGWHRDRSIGVKLGATADPPCSFEHGDEAVVRMECGRLNDCPQATWP